MGVGGERGKSLVQAVHQATSNPEGFIQDRAVCRAAKAEVGSSGEEGHQHVALLSSHDGEGGTGGDEDFVTAGVSEQAHGSRLPTRWSS